MLRTVFDDEFLQIFSYVGQKKKRIFSSLASCAIIFGNNIFKKIRTYYLCEVIYYIFPKVDKHNKNNE